MAEALHPLDDVERRVLSIMLAEDFPGNPVAVSLRRWFDPASDLVRV